MSSSLKRDHSSPDKPYWKSERPLPDCHRRNLCSHFDRMSMSEPLCPSATFFRPRWGPAGVPSIRPGDSSMVSDHPSLECVQSETARTLRITAAVEASVPFGHFVLFSLCWGPTVISSLRLRISSLNSERPSPERRRRNLCALRSLSILVASAGCRCDTQPSAGCFLDGQRPPVA